MVPLAGISHVSWSILHPFVDASLQHGDAFRLICDYDAGAISLVLQHVYAACAYGSDVSLLELQICEEHDDGDFCDLGLKSMQCHTRITRL